MEIYNKYITTINKVLQNLNIAKLTKIENLIYNKIKNKKQIFVCGNGGSASIASHFLCDFNKGIKLSSNKKLIPKIICLNDNIPLMTAISNDINYNKIFTFQFQNYLKPGDLLITLSCSGSSKNILDILSFAKKKKISTVSFTGFANKKYINYSKINLNFDVKNYGICEDLFQIIMHMLSQNIRKKLVKSKKEIL